MKVWFQKTFSSVENAIELIKKADLKGEFTIVCTHTSPDFRALKVADEFGIEPKNMYGHDYANWSLQYAVKNKIDVIVPGYTAPKVFSSPEYIELFAEHKIKLMNAASRENLGLLERKAEFYEAVNLPMTPPAEFYRFTDQAQFDSAFDKLKSAHDELCVKPSVGVYASSFSVLDQKLNCAEILLGNLQYRVPIADFRNGLAKVGKTEEMMLMEFLPGLEYSADCVANNGVLLASVIREKSESDGGPQTIVCRDDIQGALALLAKQFGLTGNFNAQFRARRNGVLGILEINARMSGGIAIACAAGPNLPYIALKAFCFGNDAVEVEPVRFGAKVSSRSEAVAI